MKNRVVLLLLVGLLVSLLFSPNAFSEDTTDALREVLALAGGAFHKIYSRMWL